MSWSVLAARALQQIKLWHLSFVGELQQSCNDDAAQDIDFFAYLVAFDWLLVGGFLISFFIKTRNFY